MTRPIRRQIYHCCQPWKWTSLPNWLGAFSRKVPCRRNHDQWKHSKTIQLLLLVLMDSEIHFWEINFYSHQYSILLYFSAIEWSLLWCIVEVVDWGDNKHPMVFSFDFKRLSVVNFYWHHLLLLLSMIYLSIEENNAAPKSLATYFCVCEDVVSCRYDEKDTMRWLHLIKSLASINFRLIGSPLLIHPSIHPSISVRLENLSEDRSIKQSLPVAEKAISIGTPGPFLDFCIFWLSLTENTEFVPAINWMHL